MMVAAAREVDLELLSDVLPYAERAIVANLQEDGDGGVQGDDA